MSEEPRSFDRLIFFTVLAFVVSATLNVMPKDMSSNGIILWNLASLASFVTLALIAALIVRTAVRWWKRKAG